MTVSGVFVNAREMRDFAPGEVIFTQGDAGEEMFGVVSGNVELRRGTETIAQVGPDGTFGEIAIIDRTPRSLTAVATEATKLAVIDRRTFLFLVHETPLFAIQVMRSLVGWLRLSATN